jgi:hypothetical protein
MEETKEEFEGKRAHEYVCGDESPCLKVNLEYYLHSPKRFIHEEKEGIRVDQIECRYDSSDKNGTHHKLCERRDLFNKISEVH